MVDQDQYCKFDCRDGDVVIETCVSTADH